jgi:GTP-binding protein HflX
MRVTTEVLADIGAGDKPSMMVFNKADRLKEVFLPRILERSYIDSLVVSAFRPEDMRRLRDAIYAYFERDMVELEVVVPYQNTWLQSQIYEYSKVLKKDYLEEGARFKIRIMKSTANWLKLESSAALAGPGGDMA